MLVLRWGRSDYEREVDRERECADARSLGLDWEAHEGRDVPEAVARADVLVVTSGVRVDADAFARFRGGLVVATTSGHDHIDVIAAEKRGVVVARCPLARRDPVVEHTLAALIALSRRVPLQARVAASGRWARGDLPGVAPRGLAGADVVVVGLGVIGSRVSELLSGLGARVRGVDPRVATPWSGRPLPEVLEGADAVTLHASLTLQSRGLLGVDALARLPDHAVLVNTARGELLDVEAAAARVRAGRLRGLAVDVFPQEPYRRLAELAGEGVWLTPHAAGFVHDLGARVADEVRATLALWVTEGRVPHRVV